MVRRHQSGFTLIELSIVLVIIGLIVGGVLVGQDLIKAATIRSQISQIEKYNQAANTFRLKFGGLPGDLQASTAVSVGFSTRAGSVGRGDGNGLLEGSAAGSSNLCGETGMFWSDLMTAGLIGDTISLVVPGGTGDIDSDLLHCPAHSLPDYTANGLLPSAQIRSGDYVTVYADMGQNLYFISGSFCIAPQGLGMCYIPGATTGNKPGLTPLEALAIDNKIDDGLPSSGLVLSKDPSTFSNSATPVGGAAGAASAGNCGSTDTSPISYNTSGYYATSVICSLSIKASF